MKITDSEVIKNGEQELIDAITGDLDWGAIEDILLKEHKLGLQEDIEYKNGDIIAYNNQIAYKLKFDVKVSLSVLLNRMGEYLSVSIDTGNINSDAADTEENIEAGTNEQIEKDDAIEANNNDIEKNLLDTDGKEEETLEEPIDEENSTDNIVNNEEPPEQEKIKEENIATDEKSNDIGKENDEDAYMAALAELDDFVPTENTEPNNNIDEENKKTPMDDIVNEVLEDAV